MKVMVLLLVFLVVDGITIVSVCLLMELHKVCQSIKECVVLLITWEGVILSKEMVSWYGINGISV